MCRKNENQFLYRLAIKRLWCNADTQMSLAFSSIMVNLHSKIFAFQYMHLLCVGTKYVVLLQLFIQDLYTSAIFTSNYEIISSYVDSTGSFLGCPVRGRKYNITTNSSRGLSAKAIASCGFSLCITQYINICFIIFFFFN